MIIVVFAVMLVFLRTSLGEIRAHVSVLRRKKLLGH